MIRLIHRADDAFTAFGVKPNGIWTDLYSLPTSHLTFAPLAALSWLTTDSYFCLNGMYRPGHGTSRAVASLPRAYRSADGLRYLNVAYTDLDVYKAGVPVEQAIAAVRSMESAGTIPPASIVVRSGRGVWLMWLLTDPTTGLPPRSYARNLRQYHDIQQAIQRRLASVGADPNATDPVRMTRVPGSIHSGTGERVSYDVRPNASTPHAYTLEGLAHAFGLPVNLKRSTTILKPAGGIVAGTRKQPGWLNVGRSRVRQLLKLQELRGGFSEGVRTHAAFLLASFLSQSGQTAGAIAEQVHALGACCLPSLSRKECDSIVSSTMRRRYRFTNATIADRLSITPQESEQLETWPAAGCHVQQTAEQKEEPTRRDKRKARRSLIMWFLEQHGGELLPARELKRLLREQGHSVTHKTVLSDLRGMGLMESGASPTMVTHKHLELALSA